MLQKPVDQIKKDKASLAENGGIDLNQINVKRSGKVVTVRFDPAQLNSLKHGGFEGFIPIITGFHTVGDRAVGSGTILRLKGRLMPPGNLKKRGRWWRPMKDGNPA